MQHHKFLQRHSNALPFHHLTQWYYHCVVPCAYWLWLDCEVIHAHRNCTVFFTVHLMHLLCSCGIAKHYKMEKESIEHNDSFVLNICNTNSLDYTRHRIKTDQYQRIFEAYLRWHVPNVASWHSPCHGIDNVPLYAHFGSIIVPFAGHKWIQRRSANQRLQGKETNFDFQYLLSASAFILGDYFGTFLMGRGQILENKYNGSNFLEG